MSKLDEKQIEKTHKSAAGQEDKAFEEWISQRVLDETAEMINGLENDPDLDDFEPSEELFQKIVGVAKERGLLAEADETAEDVVKIELSDDEKEKIVADNIPTKKGIRSDEKGKVVEFTHRRRMAVKWVAMLAVTLLGVFGISMSSQANRTYVMQKANELFGNDVNTKVKSAGDALASDTKEEIDREVIQEELNVSLPIFYYLPDGMRYIKYNIDEDAQAAYLQYQYNEKYVYMHVLANANDASGIYRNDKGVLEKNITSDWINIDAELWRIEEEGDEEPTYLVQWDYKNSYYCIFGKMSEKEIVDIVKDVIY